MVPRGASPRPDKLPPVQEASRGLVSGLDRLSRLVFVAVIAGVAAGLILTGLQRIAVVPLILEAETYETAAGAADGGAADHMHDHAGHSHDVAPATDASGIAEDAALAEAEDVAATSAEGDGSRTILTLIANVVSAAAFALILAAGMALARAASHRIEWKRGLLWGLAGFGAIQLAPALGLPPELPGAAAAELGARQGWWILTAALTAAGLAWLAFVPRAWLKPLGLVAILLPHLIGAPAPEHHGGLAPDSLATQFVYAALITNGVFWLILGALTAHLFGWFEKRRALS